MRGLKSSLALVSVAILLAASAAAYAGPWGGSCCPGGLGGGPWAAKGSGVWNELTKEQQKEITSLRTELLKKMESLRSDAAKKRIEMLELAAKDTPDETAIQKVREANLGAQRCHAERAPRHEYKDSVAAYSGTEKEAGSLRFRGVPGWWPRRILRRMSYGRRRGPCALVT